MFKKTLALVLCTLMTLGTLAACGEDAAAPYVPTAYQPDGQSGAQSDTQSADAVVTTAPADDIFQTEPTEAPTEPEETGMGNPATAVGSGMTYIGTQRVRMNDYNENGFTYRSEDDKYGVMSRDGSYDSGAVYAHAECLKGNFAVRAVAYSAPDKLEDINSVGLIDAAGNELLPARYAMIKALDDRFLQAFTVTAVTEGDEYLLYMRSNMFSLSASEEDTRYEGNWIIYDLQTRKEVPGVGSTKNLNIYAYGDILTYTEDGNKIRVTAAGLDIPQDATVFENGTYITKDADAVYCSDGTKLFDTAGLDGFDVRSWVEGYYRMNKYEGGSTKYALADESGNICSAILDFNPIVEEGGILSGTNGLFDLEGNCLFDKETLTVYYYKGYWLIQDREKNAYVMDSSYNVQPICLLDNDTYSFYGTNFAVVKKVDKEYFYYSFAQGDFIAGNPVELGVAELKLEDGSRNLINTMNDEVLLSGYRQYRIVETDKTLCVYAHAGDNAYDIFVFE